MNGDAMTQGEAAAVIQQRESQPNHSSVVHVCLCCPQCGYELAGLNGSARCPECGQTVRIAANALRRASPAWKSRVRGCLLWIRVAMVMHMLAAAALVGVHTENLLMGQNARRAEDSLALFAVTLIMLGYVVGGIAIGLMRLARKDDGVPAPIRRAQARSMYGVCAFIGVIAVPLFASLLFEELSWLMEHLMPVIFPLMLVLPLVGVRSLTSCICICGSRYRAARAWERGAVARLLVGTSVLIVLFTAARFIAQSPATSVAMDDVIYSGIGAAAGLAAVLAYALSIRGVSRASRRLKAST